MSDETVWYARDLQARSNWLYVLSPAQQQELLRALEVAKGNGCTIETIGREDFPLPAFGPDLDEIGRKIDQGVGFAVLRGMPLAGLPLEDIELLYAGLTSRLGDKINQDTRGTLIDRVYDQKKNYDDISVRGYTTRAKLTPHCDTGDLVCLLCVRPAQQGGINNISCSMAIHNELLESWPDYLEPLYRGFHYNIRGNGPVGKYEDITAHRVPVFSYHQGMLSCRYNQKAILTAQELPFSEPLSELEQQAVNKVAELAMRDDIRFDVHLEAGDLAFLNNNTVLHNRDHFIDHEDESRKRLLLRQWINLHEARELASDFADHYNTGPRKGPAIHWGSGKNTEANEVFSRGPASVPETDAVTAGQ
ncbi:MAG: TauD/TfdA family dioxygenase [Pseudohongiellaceae bacterium]